MKIFVNSAISFLYKLIFNFLIFIKAIFNPRFNMTFNAGSTQGHAHNMAANFTGDATSVVQPYLTVIYVIKT